MSVKTGSGQSKGGRIQWCPVLMLKVLVLQRFFDLSDEEAEFQILDRFSFLRFLGLRPGDGAPDHSTIWDFKERLGGDRFRRIGKRRCRFETALTNNLDRYAMFHRRA